MKKTGQKPVSVKKMIEAEIEKQLPDMPKKIERLVERALLSLMGLEQRGSRTEIDHCNGRHSILTEAFKRLAQAEAEKLARTCKFSKSDITGFRAAFEREYDSQMGRAVRDAASVRVAADLAKYMEGVEVNVEKALGLKP